MMSLIIQNRYYQHNLTLEENALEIKEKEQKEKIKKKNNDDDLEVNKTQMISIRKESEQKKKIK